MFIIYEFIYLLYCIAYFPYLKLTGRWHPDYGQRFGNFPHEIRMKIGNSRNIWVHAVSVGEVVAIEGFIGQIKDRWPGIGIVCSVTTKTGYELARKRLGRSVCVIFAPLDFTFTVNKFIKLIHPKLYIAAETEIWPNLFRCLHQAKVPIAIVNGRISDRSLKRYLAVKDFLRDVLDMVTIFAMQSDLDAERIKDLGAPPDKVWMVGNIKFDDLPKPEDATLHISGFAPQNPLWIAGSTHPGEEKIILETFINLRPLFPSWQLIIAPRHVERANEVAALVDRAGLIAVKLSELRPGNFNHRAVVVVDTIGHLRSLYAYASLVFVGKSLCVGGGHNVIEPAFYSKPIIVGPLMENFTAIVSVFKADHALVQVNDAVELEHKVKELMNDQVKRMEIGIRARAVIDKNQGAGSRALRLIEQCL